MGKEWIFDIIVIVAILYFFCRPKPKKKKVMDSLTDEIHPGGLPPSAPPPFIDLNIFGG